MSYKRKILEKNKSRERVVKNLRAGKYERHQSVASQCLKKLSYGSEREARREAERVSVERGTVLRVYQCPYCEFYHLTKKRRWG